MWGEVRNFETIEDFIVCMEEYIAYKNNKDIKIRTKQTPVENIMLLLN
ncbi:hypothetical protein [Spiroplasma endosymbiont of Virgichneumon dumeticola]